MRATVKTAVVGRGILAAEMLLDLLARLISQFLDDQAKRTPGHTTDARPGTQRRYPTEIGFWVSRGPWMDRVTVPTPHLAQLAESGDRWAQETMARISESEARMGRIDALINELNQLVAEMGKERQE